MGRTFGRWGVADPGRGKLGPRAPALAKDWTGRALCIHEHMRQEGGSDSGKTNRTLL